MKLRKVMGETEILHLAHNLTVVLKELRRKAKQRGLGGFRPWATASSRLKEKGFKIDY